MKQRNSPILVGNDVVYYDEHGIRHSVAADIRVKNYNPEIPLAHLSDSQIEFLAEGNVIPHEDGTYYFQCFVYKRLGDSNLFEQHHLHKTDLAKVGYTQEMINELKSTIPDWESK